MIPLDTLLPNDQIIRVFPVRTAFTPDDATAFVGFPPFPEFRPANRKTPVRVSVVFKWHRRLAKQIAASWAQHYDDVKIGGPAFGDFGDGEFTPGRFLKAGCTITSRGCVKDCGWCVERNRDLVELTIKPGWIVQDSNLLACSDRHVRQVFEMLREQRRRIYFNGGLDKHFLRDCHRILFDTISIGELWFACDKTADLPWLERAAKILDGIPLRKRRCYVMIGYDDETLTDSERRLERVLELGFMPFCQLFQPEELEELKRYPPAWKAVQRKWSRPAAYMPRREGN